MIVATSARAKRIDQRALFDIVSLLRRRSRGAHDVGGEDARRICEVVARGDQAIEARHIPAILAAQRIGLSTLSHADRHAHGYALDAETERVTEDCVGRLVAGRRAFANRRFESNSPEVWGAEAAVRERAVVVVAERFPIGGHQRVSPPSWA